MVGDAGRAHSTQENGITFSKSLHTVVSHYFAGFVIILTTSQIMGKIEAEAAIWLSNGLQHLIMPSLITSGTDAVTGHNRNFICIHKKSPFYV